MKVEVDPQDIDGMRSTILGITTGVSEVNIRAINRSLVPTRTIAVKLIKDDLNLTAKRIKSDFQTNKAHTGNVQGSVIAKGKPVGLFQFATKTGQKLYRINNHPKTGVKVKVKRAGKSKMLKHAFAAKTSKLRNDGSEYSTSHLFWRKKQMGSDKGSKYARYFAQLPAGHFFKSPLKRLEGPRIEDIYAKDRIYDATTKHGADTFQKEVDKGMERLIKNQNG